MEDQGKRLLLAVVAAFAVMMLWMVIFPPDQPEKDAEAPRDEAGETVSPDGEAAPTPAPAGGEAAPDATGAAEIAEAEAPPARGEEQTLSLTFDDFVATFTNYGGALKAWQLQGDKYRNDDGSQMNLVPPIGGEDSLPFVVSFPNSTLDLPEATEWSGEKLNDREVRYTYSGGGLRVIKTYTVFPDDYLIQMQVSVQVQQDVIAKQALAVSTFGYQDPSIDTGGGWTSISTEWKAACNIGGELETFSADSLRKRSRQHTGDVKWGGIVHSYFFSGISPEPIDGQLACNASPTPELAGGMRVDVVFPLVSLGQGQEFSRTVTSYMGPKYLDKLEAIPTVVGYDPGFGEAIDLGWFSFIARPLLWLLQWFQSFVINWGIAIILLTFMVKLATLYWTTKSMRSMKAMGKLRPEIEKLQKKYKDDRQRQQVEIMNLYKAHKVNPLAGCLPMLLQMPIWFALYRMLMAAGELYNAPFIPGWIDDLTSPDPYYALPILLMATMFVQARLSPTTADSTQQKIFQYGLPLMFGFFGFFFPSGLTLYILTNTVLTALHQLWMNRDDWAAAKAAKAAGGAGGPSDDTTEPDEEPEPRSREERPARTEQPERAGTSGGSSGRKRSSKKRGGKRKRSK